METEGIAVFYRVTMRGYLPSTNLINKRLDPWIIELISNAVYLNSYFNVWLL